MSKMAGESESNLRKGMGLLNVIVAACALIYRARFYILISAHFRLHVL